MEFKIIVLVKIIIALHVTESVLHKHQYDIRQKQSLPGNLTSFTVTKTRGRIECTVKCLETSDCCLSSYNKETKDCTIDMSGCCAAILKEADDSDVLIKSTHQDSKPKDCTDISNRCTSCVSGVYTIFPVGSCGIEVFCFMKLDGFAWTGIINRMNGLTNFFRGWQEYKMGFGSLNDEYWIGNDNLHLLTKQMQYQLRIDLTDFKGIFKHATYNKFIVANEKSRYKLSVGQYFGNAGDSLASHNGLYFATKDNDYNDNSSRMCGGCAKECVGAYWYHCCYDSHLTGPIAEGANEASMSWVKFRSYQSLKTARMMIRPIFIL